MDPWRPWHDFKIVMATVTALALVGLVLIYRYTHPRQ